MKEEEKMERPETGKERTKDEKDGVR